eukprot:436299_1
MSAPINPLSELDTTDTTHKNTKQDDISIDPQNENKTPEDNENISCSAQDNCNGSASTSKQNDSDDADEDKPKPKPKRCPHLNRIKKKINRFKNTHNSPKNKNKKRNGREYDLNMLAMDCDPICVNGNTYSWINGKYIWTHFNRTTNSSVYHCSNCLYSLYLYGYVRDSHSYWMIGPDHSAFDAYSWCNLGNNLASNSSIYVFNIDDCAEWHTTHEDTWVIEQNMTSKRCGSIDHKPSLETTVVDMSRSESPKAFYAMMITISILFLLLLLFACFALIKCIGAKLKKHDTKPKETEVTPLFVSPRSIPAPITNALVVVIGIGDYRSHKKYNSNANDTDIDARLKDFPVHKDVQNVRELFTSLNYTILPDETRKSTYWSEKQLIECLQKAGKELVSSDENNELKYDGLIVCISCHGIENHIITSNYKAVHKTAIHRMFSINYKQCRDIPRIFLFDCCEGTESRINVGDEGNVDGKEYSKYFGVEDLRSTQMWTGKEPNPDYKLMEIHAANVGFQAKCNERYGSYLLYEFQRRVKQSLERENGTETLGRIFEKIQNHLHEKGKQQTINVFNNNTRYLRLQKHDNAN